MDLPPLLQAPRCPGRSRAAMLVMLCVCLGVSPLIGAEDGGVSARTAEAKEAGVHAHLAAAAAHPLRSPNVLASPQPRTVSTSLTISAVSIAVPIDPTQVARYSKVELHVAMTTTVAATSFYNPDPLAGGIALSCTFLGPTGTSWVIPGFYDGSTWRVRFAPDTVGTWQYTVSSQDSTGTATATPGTFTVISSSSRGWVRITGNHLSTSADNKPFIGIGHNNGFLDGVETPLISAMPALGENVLSFWLANPFGSGNGRNPIEATTPGGIGIYDQTACGVIDTLFAHAEASGVYLLPSIWAHPQLYDHVNPSGWGTGTWVNNAYSTIPDPNTHQPITPQAFFQTVDGTNAPTKQWTYQQNFYRYLIARWGYSTSLLGWVGVVEIEGTTSYYNNSTQGNIWCTAVNSFFALNDPFRGSGSLSGTFPMGFSMSDQAGTGALSFDSGFSMRIIDSYLSQVNSVGIASTIISETHALHDTSAKPMFHSEFGGEINSSAPTAIEPLHFHNAIWAGMASGASLTPLKYCDGSHWPLINDPTYNYGPHTLELSRFLATVPYVGGGSVVDATASINIANMVVTGQALSDRAFVWLQDTISSPNRNGLLSITNLTNGPYAVIWYDPWSTTFAPLLSTTATVSGGTLTTTIPTGTNADLVVRVQMQPIAIPQSVSVVTGTTIAITLAGTDGTSSLSGAAISSDPTQGSLFQTSDGVSAGSPISGTGVSVTNAGMVVIYQAGASAGSDSFTFTVNDTGVSSAPATITIQILPVNKPPLFTAGSNVTVAEDASPTTVSNWATSIHNDPSDVGSLTAFTVSTDQPTWFSAQPAIDVVTGTLSFSTSAHITGTVHASATLSNNGNNAGDGQGTSAAQAFQIIINHTAHQPVMSDQTLTTYQNFPLTITLAATVPDNATLVYAATSAPAHGTLVPVGGSLSALGTPPSLIYTATTSGSASIPDSFSVSASDSSTGGSPTLTTSATIHITIVPNASPTATAQNTTVIENRAVGIVLAGTDPDNLPLPLTFTVATTPIHGTLSGTSPGLTYTPTLGYVGTDSFTYTAFDGAATSPPAAVVITVISPGSSSTSSGGGGCGSGNGFAALVLILLSVASGRWLVQSRRL